MSNFFEKLGLVEAREPSSVNVSSFDDVNVDDLLKQKDCIDEPQVNMENVSVETLISDIYRENEISETNISIYKVQELSDTLPKEMRTEVKKSTVLGILKVSGIEVDNVISDGLRRIELLESANEKITSKSDSTIKAANDEIEELKARIEELQKTIALTDAEKEKSNKLITDEVSKITELCKFIGGN